MLDVRRFFSYGILLDINLFFYRSSYFSVCHDFMYFKTNDWNLNYAFHIHAELSDC